MRVLKRILVTGGAGFIGSSFIQWLLRKNKTVERIVNFDKLTYAASLRNLKGLESHPRYRFIQGDINDCEYVEDILQCEQIDGIIHFAAQTHVDRSIIESRPFLQDNVAGTLSLLEVLKSFPQIHFHHISTDEVYGSLGESGAFNEHSSYRPNSPYAASKAASDLFVRAFSHTYGLSITVSHCSNNYGPGQHQEKFIPRMISRCLEGKDFPIYGCGRNVRDWLYVDDHVSGVWLIALQGKRGQSYGMGGGCEKSNLELIHLLIEILSEELKIDVKDLYKRIRFVKDRLGHDFRYAINNSKIRRELQWCPRVSLQEGLRKTVRWYIKEYKKSNSLMIKQLL